MPEKEELPETEKTQEIEEIQGTETDKLPLKLTRHVLQAWWPPHALSENGNQFNLNVGDIIVKNLLERVYLDANVSDNEILNNVLAFKNNFDGEIFLGVKENGEITGMNFSGNRREEIAKAIGELLPDDYEGADTCENVKEAIDLFLKNKCFVCSLKLSPPNVTSIGWIHVPKSEARVCFRKPSDTNVHKRVGAENKLVHNCDHLFGELESLSSRQIEKFNRKDDKEGDMRYKEEKIKSQEEKTVLEVIKHENQHNESKMIFAKDPVKKIKDTYLAEYIGGFLNSSGGTISFGIQEDKTSKMCYVVGIVLSTEERKALVDATIKTLEKFYPPVNRDKFEIKFYQVRVPSDMIVKEENGNSCVVIGGPVEIIGNSLPKFIHANVTHKSRVAAIPIRSKRFCLVATKQTSARGNLVQLVKKFVTDNKVEKDKKNKKDEITLQTISEAELKTILQPLSVMELKVRPSPHPIYMYKTIDTYVFTKDKEGQLRTSKLSLEDLMYRFKLDPISEFNVDKFLEHVRNFQDAGNSYVLVASPFDLSENERDLYGLVTFGWNLVIDLDQQPKQTGHLFHVFKKLRDHYQITPDLSLQRAQDSQPNLNTDKVVRWVTARGYRDNRHQNWNQYIHAVMKTNRLNVVILWDECDKKEFIMNYKWLRKFLKQMNEIVVTFVCATPKTALIICEKIIKPLQQDGFWDTISKDRIHVAPPYVLARFLSLELPRIYRPEEADYQVPHKIFFPSGGSQIVPQVLHHQLRKKLLGCIEVMYMKTGTEPDEKKLDTERRNFFSGSAITKDGLHGNIAIRRTEMSNLEKEFEKKVKFNNVSFICVKADHGAGSTTMCLQFLYQQHRSYPCAKLTRLKKDLEFLIQEINRETKLPLILLVDKNIAHSDDFLEFKENVECLKLSVIFILIEPAEKSCGSEILRTDEVSVLTQESRTNSATFLEVSVELRQKLDEDEIEQLTNIFTKLEEEKGNELLKFREDARNDGKPQTFAHFSLLVFGREYKGLNQYVKFRLEKADERQKDMLAFLSLINEFTDYSLPENALVGFLGKEIKLHDKHVQELLSPRTGKKKDSRRILFNVVAKEILKQLSNTNGKNDQYWTFIKYVSVKMARYVLSKNTRKKIDRLTIKLFVTSKQGKEDFSPLIRKMKDESCSTALDALKELVEVFGKEERHSSISVYLQADLAKYYTSKEYFEEAKKLIKAAICEQKLQDDSLLHHIHGDIIRRQVVILKDRLKEEEDMDIIISHALESSKCFELVRSKSPHMSHGYVSDAMVRITVMQAGIKLMGGNVSFVDFVIERINQVKQRDDECISLNLQYLLSLISDAYDHLDERTVDFEQRENWKGIFLCCIGDLDNLTRLCNEIQDKSCSPFLQTQVLYNALLIENEDLSPCKIESELKKMEEYDSGDRFMKFWIRFSRKSACVPNLLTVKTKVNKWFEDMGTPQAKFYK